MGVVSTRTIIKYWSPVMLWMVLIFWMSTGTFSAENTASLIKPLLLMFIPWLSADMIDTVHHAMRKFGHLIEYFVLGLLLLRAIRGDSTGSCKARWFFPAFFILLLYAAGDEFHQSFVASRTASLEDVGIDVAGGVLALGISALRHRRIQRR